MNVVAVGVGGAGGRVVDQLGRDAARRSASYLSSGIAFDTDRNSLAALDSVPAANRYTFGEVAFEGAGSDGDRAAVAVAEQVTELRREVDDAVTTDLTAVVLAAGLGGGVGAGATPAVASALAEVYERPLYGVSVLPTSDDGAGAGNAAAALGDLDETLDTQVVFDNEAWVGSDESVEGRVPALNRELAERLGTLFLAGDVRAAGEIGETVVDERDVIETLSAGGLASIGHASQQVSAFREPGESAFDRLRDRLVGSVSDEARYEGVRSVLRWAARGQLTLDCSLDAAGSALVLFSGPPDWLDREAVAEGRRWVDEQTGGAALRTGDAPIRGGDELAALVALAGIESAPRIEELQWY